MRSDRVAGAGNMIGRAQPRGGFPACPRAAFAAAADASGHSYAALSRMLSRRDGYLACYVREGHPRALSERDHQVLLDFFGLPPRGLGVRKLWEPLAA